MRVLGLSVLFLVLGGCGAKHDLDPLSGVSRVQGIDEGVLASSGDVRVVLQTTHWPGPTAIQQEITPVRVLITNQGKDPIAIRYQDFALYTPSGERLGAIPPFEVSGSVQQPITAGPAVMSPTFSWTGFSVAPAYAPIYPTLTPWGSGFAWDPWYYRNYSSYWVNVPLPSPDMLAAALPEGVLQPGGRLDGWLYFPGIPRSADTVTFHAAITNPLTGIVSHDLEVPYDAG
jgi:hypothetical protein